MSDATLVEEIVAKVISLGDETKFVPEGIVSRTLFQTPNSRLVLFSFSAGEELTTHTTTKHAFIQILTGECEFVLDGKPCTLKAGHLLYMPPNLPHALKATHCFSMLLTLSTDEKTCAADTFDVSIR